MQKRIAQYGVAYAYTDSIEPPDRRMRAIGPMDESHESDWREPVINDLYFYSFLETEAWIP